MATPGSMTRWADALRSPDPRVRDLAARMIWERYAAELLALVRRRLGDRIRRRADEHDVVQELYVSFCLGQRDRPDPLRSRDELWRLLVRIALCKVGNAVKRHQAARRDVRREVPLAAPGGDPEAAGFPDWMLVLMDRSEPSPEEAASVQEQLEEWLRELTPEQRRIALWRLEGYTNREIGDKISRTERCVELKLKIIRGALGRRLAMAEQDGASP